MHFEEKDQGEYLNTDSASYIAIRALLIHLSSATFDYKLIFTKFRSHE